MAKEKKEKGGAPDADGKGPPKDKRDKKDRAENRPEAQAGAPEAATAEPSPPKAKKAKKAPGDSGGGVGAKRRGRPMRGRSKRHNKLSEKITKDKQYPLPEAVKLLKQVTTGTKFNQTVNIVMHLGIDPKNSDQMIRGAVSLPKGIGSTKKVIAFCDGAEADAAKAAGAMEVGVDDLVKKVNDGWSDFDVAIAHPRAMGKVGKLGRVLGPQGKMPSPKNGTVTADIAQAVKEFAAGKIEFRNDAGGNVHAIIGKANFSEDDLRENIDSFIHHIRRLKPPTSKGHFIKKVCIHGAMSPAVELEVAQ